MQFKLLTPFDPGTAREKEEVVEFLYRHLDQYGDAKEDIQKAVAYALKERESHGGFVLAGKKNGHLVGAVVINKTGMEGYIPENILVYIAVDGTQRGQGTGKQLMAKVMDVTDGAIALHVEPDNPARFLYEKMGFSNKYLEMRYHPN